MKHAAASHLHVGSKQKQQQKHYRQESSNNESAGRTAGGRDIHVAR
jgi:hypothetical protein